MVEPKPHSSEGLNLCAAKVALEDELVVADDGKREGFRLAEEVIDLRPLAAES